MRDKKRGRKEDKPMDTMNQALRERTPDEIYVPHVRYRGSQATSPMLRERDLLIVPLLMARPISRPSNEEELHTSFQQAISERLLVLNLRLSRIRGSLVTVWPPLLGMRGTRRWRRWQRGVILSCAAAILVLASFDLAVLLLLCAR